MLNSKKTLAHTKQTQQDTLELRLREVVHCTPLKPPVTGIFRSNWFILKRATARDTGALSLHLWVYSQNIICIYTKSASYEVGETERTKGRDQDVPKPTDTDMDPHGSQMDGQFGWPISISVGCIFSCTIDVKRHFC